MSIAARIVTGALLAGVYPVGMKIAVGWGQKDRGFLVGLLIGALTWAPRRRMSSRWPAARRRATVLVASAAALLAGIVIVGVRLGPTTRRRAFDPR